MNVFSESTGEAWEKASLALLDSGEETTISKEKVVETRWFNIHVTKPLQEPRISDRFDEFYEKIGLEDKWRPEAYLLQVTKQVTKGYWWEIYGKPIWNQIPKLVTLLKKSPSHNKPSITIRNSKKHLGREKTPCLVYLTFLTRNRKLELGVHFDTNAIEYIQGNMYGCARAIGIETGAYHHFSDSLFISKKYSPYLDKTLKR